MAGSQLSFKFPHPSGVRTFIRHSALPRDKWRYSWAEFKPEFQSCETRLEQTPHPARYSRHPLPKGEGR